MLWGGRYEGHQLEGMLMFIGDTRTSAVAVTAVAVLAVAAAAGCSGGNKATSSSTASLTSTAAWGTSSAEPSPVIFAYAPPGDYTGLLINASDIGPDITTSGPPKIDPHGPGQTGVAQRFTSSDGRRIINDAISVLIDPANAAQFPAVFKVEMSKDVAGIAEQPIDVGTNGLMDRRYYGSGKNRRQVTDLAFVEGRAAVWLAFLSASNDPIPTDIALDIARKQDAAIKNGLPG
jgi:hypothetical protein